MANNLPSELEHEALKAKQRELREGFPEGLTLRVHRALSWLGRACNEESDLDARFVFYWIAFNSAYARDPSSEIGDDLKKGERSAFAAFFRTMVDLDKDQRLFNTIWSRFPGPIRLILENKFVYQPFWHFHNGLEEYRDWERRFEQSKSVVNGALRSKDTILILSILFDRLYVLRNQLVHGGATWNSSANRDQLRDGVAILGFVVPIFIDIMMENPHQEWGAAHYPVVEI